MFLVQIKLQTSWAARLVLTNNCIQDLLNGIGAIGTYKPATEGEAFEKADEFFGGQKIFADFRKMD